MRVGTVLNGGKSGITLEVVFIGKKGIVLQETYTKQSLYITFKQIAKINFAQKQLKQKKCT